MPNDKRKEARLNDQGGQVIEGTGNRIPWDTLAETYKNYYVRVIVKPIWQLTPGCRPEGRHNAHQVIGKIGTEPVTGGRLSDPTPRAADEYKKAILITKLSEVNHG